MARVCIYERAVNAVLTDVTLYDNSNRAENGMKIKQEPLDPDVDQPDDSLSFTNTDTVVQCNSVVVENEMISCNLHNERHERVSSGEHVSSEQNKPGLNRKKRKRVENPETLTRNKSHSRQNLDIVGSKRKKMSPKRLECDVCYLTFPRESTLRLHKTSNALINKSVKYCCDICNGMFVSNCLLHKHRVYCVASQGQNVPRKGKYVCNFCERKFASKTSLQSHLFHIHENLMLPTVTLTNKIEEAATIDDIDCYEVNVDISEKSKENLSNAASKKMRQTTLTEFLPLFSKYFIRKEEEVCANPDETTVAATVSKIGGHGTSVNPLSGDGFERRAKDNENCTSVTSPTNPSSTGERPFVQIHVNPDTMMSLLNTKIKTELEDSHTAVASHNAPYNFRRLRSDSRRSSFEQGGVPAKPTRREKKTVKCQDTWLWTRQIKTKFNCKECIIRLEKCNKTLNSEKSRTEEPESFPGPKDLIQIDENFEVNTNIDVESNLALKNLEVPLVRVNKLAKVAVNESVVSSEESHVSHERKVFQCKICKKSFSSKENMREHIELFHVAYMSSICSARYTSMHKLLNHHLRQHAMLKRKTCCVCREKFITPRMLKQHMVLHCIKIIRPKNDKVPMNSERKCNMFKKRNRCKNCGKRFWLKSCLMQHQRMCHRRNVRVAANTVFVAQNEKQKPLDTVEANVANIPLIESDLNRMSDKINMSSADVKTTSPEDTISSQEETKSRSPKKTVSHKRLITGIACVKGYQVDANGTEKIKFPCSICGKQFQTFQNLCMHERTFCKPADNPCTVCGTAFSTKRLLQLHLLATHTPSCTESYKYFCRFCKQGFVKKSNVQIHERHFHSNEVATNPKPSLVSSNIWNVNTVCIVCNLMFESYERFIEHNMYYYKGQVFTCTFCGKSFQGMYMLHHHSKLVHYPEDTRNAYTYTCDTCNEGFNQESHFHAHKLHVHLHEASSVQDPTKSVQDHANQDHNYALMSCNGILTASTIKVPIMAYTCDICSLNFTNERDLSMHEMEYSDDGNFQCDTCDRKCRTAAILIKHQSLNHSGCDISSCYKCRFCGEIATTNTAMVCHEKHFHGNNTHLRSKGNTSDQLDASHNARADSVGQPDNGVGNCMCLTCGMKFENEIKLKEHLLEYSDIGTFTCEICHRKFAELCRLEAHKIKHSRLNYILSEHHCPICHEGFASATNVRTHVLHLHGYETFPSVIVKRTNHSNSNTKCSTNGLESRQIDRDEGTSKLEQSNKNNKSINTDVKDDRMRNATGSPNIVSKLPLPLNAEKKSSTCPASPLFNSTKRPNASNVSFVGEMQKHEIKCSECGLVFNNSTTLMRHKLRFINCGDYVCKHCGHRFPTLTIFNSHLIKHSVDVQIRFLKYKCSYCNEKFRTPISVYSHVAHVHGKDKLKNESIAVNKSRINEFGMKCSESCGNDCFDILGKVFNNDDLERSQSHDTNIKSVDASNLDGRLERSSSIVVSLLNEASNMAEEDRDLENLGWLYYTCPICNLIYPTLKQFQKHFKVTHGDKIHETIASPVEFDKENPISCLICNDTCSNELDFNTHMEKVHVPRPRTDQTVSKSISSSFMGDDSDVIEIIWEKRTADADPNRNSEVNDTYDPEIQLIDYNYSISSTEQPKTLPNISLTNVVTVTDDVGKLKVKSFAKMMN